MNEKHALEAGQIAAQRVEVATARVAADTRRRWDEVRQAREQVMSRQEQVIQQTRADVRRHVERMRNVRAAIISPDAPRVAPVSRVEPIAARPVAPQVPVTGPRFDFDSRRVAWEQRRREQAEKRRAEIALLNEPYQAQRRMLEEKRRQALLNQEAARKPHLVGAHQLKGAELMVDRADDHETIIAINVVVEELVAAPNATPTGEFHQHCLFADEA